MKFTDKVISSKNTLAWVLMVFSVALHVIDEALSGFLPFYNDTVLDLREKLGFFPAPTFSFEMWIGGLITAVILAFCITPLVISGGKIMRFLTMVLGILMVINALIHITGSVYSGEILPGMWSSPFLLAAAAYVVYRGLKGEWEKSR